MQDQYWAGAILWATGDLTMLGVMTALFLGWYRESVREAKRVDRQLDREDAARERAAAVIADDTMQPLPADHEDLTR
jgi:putative copper resistance protein D